MALEVIVADKKDIEKSKSKFEAPSAPPVKKFVNIIPDSINTNNTVSMGAVWTNNNVKVIRSIYCLLPYSIFRVMNDWEMRMDTKNIEFGMYLKGTLKENVLNVSEEFMVPVQEVNSVKVDFEKKDHTGWNGVIHRHPDGVKSFSGTDETYINQNFEFSLLYVDGKISKGIYNLDVPSIGRIRLDLDINYSYKEMPAMKQFENKIYTMHSTAPVIHNFSGNKYSRKNKVNKHGIIQIQENEIFDFYKGGKGNFNFKDFEDREDNDNEPEDKDVEEIKADSIFPDIGG